MRSKFLFNRIHLLHSAKYHRAILLNSAIAVMLSILFTACISEVPDNSTPVIYDSSRFTWEIDTIQGIYFLDGVFIDTGRIYFITWDDLYIYNGNSIERHYFGGYLSGYCISGTDGNNILIGGSSYSYTPTMIKWNGASFDSFPLYDTTGRPQYFHSVLAKSPNEAWLSSMRGNIYRFNGSTYQRYSFDTNYWYINPFMIDGSNNTYFSSKIYSGSPVENTLLEMHKFEGSSWSTVYSENVPGGYGGLYFNENIGSRIFSVLDDEIKEFNGSGFTEYAKLSGMFTLDGELAGSSPANIFVNTFEPATGKEYLMNYNGARWSKELVENEDFQNFHYIYASDSRVYLISFNYTSENSIIVKGTRR